MKTWLLKGGPFLPRSMSWILRAVAAVILIQTLYFKFTGSPESVHIFSTVGAEPEGRIGSGVVELIASVLLLWPSFSAFGSMLALGVMTGAIASHLTVLGIEVLNDGGLLFALALSVWLISLIVLLDQRQTLIQFYQRIVSKRA